MILKMVRRSKIGPPIIRGTLRAQVEALVVIAV